MILTRGASLPAVAHMPAPNHVEVLSRLALSFQDVIPDVLASFHLEPGAIYLKVGINSGPVIGGVIGKLLPRYRIFGDTVNICAIQRGVPCIPRLSDPVSCPVAVVHFLIIA